MEEPRFDERVVCCPRRLDYDFQTHTGILFLPGVNCPDMDGTIALFAGIDADVKVIHVVSEEMGCDLTYAYKAGKWNALEGRNLLRP